MAECILVSVNIEGDRHLPCLFSFLERKDPDIICLQEVFESDLDEMKRRFGMKGIFVPMAQGPRGVFTRGRTDGPSLLWGLGILTRMKIIEEGASCYAGDEVSIPSFVWGDVRTYRRMLGHIVVEKEGRRFYFLNTHFTWTPNGEPSCVQRRDMKELIDLLSGYPELVLCGDLNAPRGGEMFSALSERYTDNIPSHVTTTIDGALHRSGPLEYVVDGLFSTREYAIRNVSVDTGVSDHCALSACIAR